VLSFSWSLLIRALSLARRQAEVPLNSPAKPPAMPERIKAV
jgi:hypothetical protein